MPLGPRLVLTASATAINVTKSQHLNHSIKICIFIGESSNYLIHNKSTANWSIPLKWKSYWDVFLIKLSICLCVLWFFLLLFHTHNLKIFINFIVKSDISTACSRTEKWFGIGFDLTIFLRSMQSFWYLQMRAFRKHTNTPTFRLSAMPYPLAIG